MKKRSNIIVALLFWVCPVLSTAPTVRVLIDEKNQSINCSKAWTLVSDSGFILTIPHKSFPSQLYKKNSMTLGHRHKLLCINGQSYHHDQIKIIPKNGYAELNGIPFHGSFSITKHADKTLLINHVGLEQYVCSVLKTESWPGWPIEVNKAFAIASRSYVLAMMKKQVKSPYHVKNSNHHQTYRGMHDCPIIRAAVKQTEGIFLTHNNEPALTMFDSCCGGIIPAHIDDFEFNKVPYLARSYPCTHCKNCSIYSWKKEIDLQQFTEHIADLITHPGSIQSIVVSKKDKAGVVKELRIKKGDHHHTLSGQQLYSALKEVKSFCYSVKKQGKKITISGLGFGHHIGLCQWGAREMVRDGWPYKHILEFYYPGTTFSQLKS